MRLIDVDHFKQKNPSYLELDIPYVTETTVEDVLDEEPTVEAIPKEWIKEQLQKAVDFTHSKAEGKFIDNGCVVEVVSASFTANVLLNLLEIWEKENERK